MPSDDTFETNWKFSKKFDPQLQQLIAIHLIAPHAIRPAFIEEDRNHNTDLQVYNIGPARITCRVRRREFFPRYEDEITVRSRTRYRVPTEYHKLIEGWGDYGIYAIARDNDNPAAGFISWILGKWDVFRKWHDQELALHAKLNLPGRSWPWRNEVDNGDRSAFLPFSIPVLLDQGFAVAHDLPFVRRKQTQEYQRNQQMLLADERVPGLFQRPGRPGDKICGCGEVLLADVSLKRGHCEACDIQRRKDSC